MQCLYGSAIAAQLRDASASFLLICNPYAGKAGVDGLGELPTYCEYLERLEKARDRQAFTFAVHQLMDLAEILGRMDEWSSPLRSAVGARYAAHRLDGDEHKWADMMAHQTPPGALTDREFLEGHCNGNQFEGHEAIGDAYKAMAEAEGVDTTGAVYINGLASFAGDPRAWVRGRGDVLKLCAERGYNAEGAVSYRSESRDAAPEEAVADDIVEQRVLSKLEKDPGLALRDPGEVFHEAKQEIQPHWSPAA